MFKRIVIELTGPICTCKVGKLSWCPRKTDEGYGFKIWCDTCDTTILVPFEKFIAGWRLDAPYPEQDTGDLVEPRKEPEPPPEDHDEALGSEPEAQA